MLPDLLQDVADAIDTHTFTQTLDVSKSWVPYLQLKDADVRKVLVSPKSIETSLESRNSRIKLVTVYVSLMSKVDRDGEDGTVDSLVQLLEEIDDHLASNRQLDTVTGVLLSTETVVAVDQKHLDEWGQFTGILEATYRVVV